MVRAEPEALRRVADQPHRERAQVRRRRRSASRCRSPTTRWCSRSSTAAPGSRPRSASGSSSASTASTRTGRSRAWVSASSIVRGLVESCGGTVWVEDAPGGGAAFRVSLRANTVSRATTRRWCMSERPKVLIVDDEPDVLLTLRMILEAEGFDPAARRRRRDRAATRRRGASRPRRARHHDAGARRLVRARRARRSRRRVRRSWCARRSRATATGRGRRSSAPTST